MHTNLIGEVMNGAVARIKKPIARTLVLLSFATTMVLASSLIVLPARSAVAIAPGCTASRPTAIGGTIYGYGGRYNNWSVSVLVGMDLWNSSRQKVDIDGKPTTKPYSYDDRVNPTLGQPGAPSGHDRTFGERLSTRRVCVSSKIMTAFFEVYPKDTHGETDKTYFGEAADQWHAVRPGATNSFTLRIPTGHDHGGNTGDVNGYVTYQGHRVDPSRLTFRAWPNDRGSACGVQGFSAHADVKTYSSSRDATYYNIRFLAGGQCHAASQSYRVYVYCDAVCGSAGRVIKQASPVRVANGARPRVDFAF
jgi:hypothetical protein